MTSEPLHLTELQLAILRVFWARGEATVPEVYRALLDERGLAQSTIATLITRLEKRGVLERSSEGRQFVYRPTVSEDEVRRSMVEDLTSVLFRGDPRALLAHLVEADRITPGDLEYAQGLLDSVGDDEPEAGRAG